MMNTRGSGSAWRLLNAVVLLSLVSVMLPAPVLAQEPLTQPATTGTLEVCKKVTATSVAPAEPFTFSVSTQTAPLTVTAGSCATLANVTTGSVTVTEQPMTPWQVTAINFLNGTGTMDVPNATVVATITAGGTTKVEFVNDSPTPVQPAVNCVDPTRPDSAQHILVFPEQEVGVTYQAGSSPRWSYYQYANGTLSNMVSGTPEYANGWQRSVAVDMNGDGWDETVSAYRDSTVQLAVRSDIWHAGLTTQGADTWVSNTDRLQGNSMKWIDIAAGNLRRHSDARRDVVIVAANDQADLEVILLDGSDDGGIGPASGTFLAGGDHTDPTDGRETVSHVSVATGDLNADGFDDEVVAAFKDGGNHLQVLVLRYYNNTWQKLASYRYTDEATSHGAHWVARTGDLDGKEPHRGVAVATGDVEGDGMDEAIIAFVDYDNHLQTIAMGLTPASGDTYTLQEEGFYRAEEDTPYDPAYVSVAAPDLNGDALAEILVAFAGRNNGAPRMPVGQAAARVWRLSYGEWVDDPNDATDSGTFLKRDQVWRDKAAYDDGVYIWAEAVSIAKVNVDKGAREKAVLAFNAGKDGNDHVEVRLLYEPGDAQSLALAASQDITTGADINYDVSAIAGDVDANSSWLTYTGECKQYGVSNLNTVLNVPPVWYDYVSSYLGPAAAFGRGITGAVVNSETTEFSYGASFTFDGSVQFANLSEVGPKLSAEFESSHAVSEEESIEIGTEEEYATVFPYDSASGLVVQQTLDYHLYKYTEDSTGKVVWVRVPVFSEEYNDSMEKWNTRQNYRGWLPVGPRPRVNLALGKPANQSSDFSGAVAGRAVDGNTDGDWNHNSVSSTNNSVAGAWWQVDLGDGQAVEQPIESVTIWNRTDCCAERLANYVVKVYDKNRVLTWQSPTQTAAASAPTLLPVGRTGRILRIQLVGTNYLALAEVEVWKDPRINLAQGRSAKQSSTYSNIASAGRAVDGNTDGNYFNGSVSSTESEANAWWQVDLGDVYPINEIDIWNRTDCCADRLVNYKIKLSDADTDAAWASPKWTSGKHEVIARRPTTDKVGQKARYVRIQFVDGYTNYLSLAEVQVWKGREVSDYPKLISRDSKHYFTITNQDGSTEKVPGNLKWDWCGGYLDEDAQTLAGKYVKDLVKKMPAKWVYQGQTELTWSISASMEDVESWTDKWGIKSSFGFEAKYMGVGFEFAYTAGLGREETTTQAWSDSTYLEGRAGYLEQNTRAREYKYCPYYYMTTSTAPDGVQQAYMVLDYYVTTISAAPTTALSLAAPAALPDAKPGTPLITSATHPEPDAWSTKTTATFTWQQPADDPVAHPLYAWVFDRQPDTVPGPQVSGPNQTDSYYNLPDGTFYLHVRAMSAGGEWSDTAHRRIRIDRLAPEVALARDPLGPGGNQGWYAVPVTVTASATDAGSGLAAVETSSDGTSWQPYAGPLQFIDNTPPTTIWARASDFAGHVSEPVSTTLKIDLTPPNSQGLGSCGSGGACAGGIIEAISGLAGMEIQVDGGSWTSATILSQLGDVPTPWAYAALLDVGHGHHIIYGRAADGAGHVEAPHKITEATFYPKASPDLSASSIAFEPAIARPGETVTLTLNVRNGGLGEAYVAISATLPVGLTPAEGALTSPDDSIIYDPATGVITWRDQLLWPGETWRTQFQAVVAEGLPASTLTAQLGAYGSWPNIELLTPEEQQRFRDYEASATVSADLRVDPQLPPGQDVTAPHVQLMIRDEAGAAGARVDLALQADADAWLMYLREWTLDPESKSWTVARDSGWIPYAPSLTWDLSNGGGVKYLGAWVRDASGNGSTLDEASLDFTNRLIEDDLAAGQRRQYRFMLEDGIAVYNLLITSGQADLFAWLPRQGGPPAYVAEGSGLVKTLGFRILLEGVYLLEAAAVTDSTYTLLDATRSATAQANEASEALAPPDDPLTLTTPLTAGAGAAPELILKPLYLPIIFH